MTPVVPERRVAFLRAINVGGTGTLRMADLRALVDDLGWKDAITLGASGNVLYSAGRTKPETDAKRLAAGLAEFMGRPATVIVRTRAELERLVSAQPFARADPNVPPKWWFVGFLERVSDGDLPDVPTGAPLAYAKRLPREVCWTMAAPDRRAIDLPKRIEKAFALALTVRNWNVVNRVLSGLEAGHSVV
jgi:uncharacterized protein (DUF1697 family)